MAIVASAHAWDRLGNENLIAEDSKLNCARGSDTVFGPLLISVIRSTPPFSQPYQCFTLAFPIPTDSPPIWTLSISRPQEEDSLIS